MSGTLFVVATPLGHLDDLSARALRTLREVDSIACEDTRRTARLLARFGVETPTFSCHRFNEPERIEPILQRLREGRDVALVSDGGSPGISDPGALLVRSVAHAGLMVRPIPGPSAVAALLSVSGLSADRFVFDGFLPARAGERRRRLRELRDEPRTLVLFEAPHRIRATLEDLELVFGPRDLVLGRELTKQHETILRGTAAEIAVRLGPTIRGEIALAVAGAAPGETPAVERQGVLLLEAWREALATSDGDRRAALRRLSRELGLKRAELYRRLVELGERDEG